MYYNISITNNFCLYAISFNIFYKRNNTVHRHSTFQGDTAGWPLDDCMGIVRWPCNHVTINNWRAQIGRWSSGHPQASVRRPGGARLVDITDNFRWWPLGRRALTARWPNDEWIIGTSADHPANFNCELKCSGCLWMSKGWALQECLFRRRLPDFCRIWCKTRRALIRRSILLYCDVGISSNLALIRHNTVAVYKPNVMLNRL